MISVFAPASKGTISLAATSASGQVLVASSTSSPVRHCYVYNAGPQAAFVEFGTSGIAAVVPTTTVTGAMPIPAGLTRTLLMNATYAAALCAGTGTATLYFTPGDGFTS